MMKILTNRNLAFILSLIALLYMSLAVYINAYHYLPVMQNAYKEIVLFTVNMTFLFMIFGLIVCIVKDLFTSREQNNDLIRSFLIFLSALMMFSRAQEVNLTWGVHEQLFATYFFTLLTFYLLSKLLIYKNRLLLFGVIVSGILSAVLIYSSDILSVSGHVNETMTIESLEFTQYFLTYLGGVFYYISGKECVSIAVIAGLFLLGTLLYFGYMIFIKKIKNPLYLVLWLFLFFYVLIALVTVQNELHFEIHSMFKYEYMTLSLMSWNLLIILYVHLFKENEKMLHKLFILGITFSVFLLGYQLTIYKNDPKELLHKKSAVFALEMQIRDIQNIKTILDSVDVYIKEPKKDNESIFESKELNYELVTNRSNEFIKDNLSVLEYDVMKDIIFHIGTTLEEFPKKELLGYLEKVTIIKDERNILRINGWVYDTYEKKVPSQLYVVDETNKVIGYLLSGISRGDVRKIYGKRSLDSGFVGYIINTQNKDKFFFVDINNKKKLEVKLPKSM